MKVRMLENKVAVESLTKARKGSVESLLTLPDSTDCTGRVKYVSDKIAAIKVGDVVCYGTSRQRVRLGGADLEIMEPDNIFAVLDDEEAADVKEKETSQ